MEAGYAGGDVSFGERNRQLDRTTRSGKRQDDGLRSGHHVEGRDAGRAVTLDRASVVAVEEAGDGDGANQGQQCENDGPGQSAIGTGSHEARLTSGSRQVNRGLTHFVG